MTSGIPGGNGKSDHPPGKLGAAILSLLAPGHSVGGKLVVAIVVATAIALAAAGVALLASDVRASRAAWANDLATEAGFLALSLQAQLAFEDREGAQRILEALQARPAIEVAALYDSRGAPFARYPRGLETLPQTLPPPMIKTGVTVEGDTIELLQPVEQGGERLGTLYVRARHDISARVFAYVRVLAAVMGLGLLVAVVCAGWLRRLITRPMESIVGTARQIVEHHDYSVRATKTTQDEFGLLVDAFNSMLDEVQAQARALIDTDRRKDEFLATLAHELRNPLAPIRNAVRILGNANANSEQRSWGEDIIARQVHRMALLLDDLLDVSRITRGKLELKKEYVELKTLIATALETARPLIDAKCQEITVELPDAPLCLEVDPLRMSQVVGNLLTNAAKYTDSGGHICLRATRAGAGLAISVKDNGIGIAADKMPALFTLFSQVNSAVDRAEGGLGIGLALTRGLTGLHGGRVEARSEGLGKGSEFIVYLPPETLAQSAPLIPVSSGVVADASRRRGKVLVSDDNRDAAESLAVVLRLAGYEVFIAFSGPDALAAGAREKPHAILLDIGMPGMSGYEVARRIRLEAWGKGARLIAITGWGQEQDKQMAKAMGFDEHLTKPVSPTDVEKILGDLVPVQTATPARELRAPSAAKPKLRLLTDNKLTNSEDHGA